MTATIEVNASKPAVPAELLGKTSVDIRAQIAVLEELDTTRAALSSAREELKSERGRTNFGGGEDEEETRVINRRIAKVDALRGRIAALDRDIAALTREIWEPAQDRETLRAALEAAEALEGHSSLELRARAIQLEETIARAKEDLAIAGAAESVTKRALPIRIPRRVTPRGRCAHGRATPSS